jgi:hypothetical protein
MPTPDLNLTDAFYAALPDELQAFITADSQEIMRIPAKASEVGDVVVHIDSDQLTVCVGHIDHTHFEVYCARGATEHERQREMAEDAVKWIEDVLAERVRFRLQFEAGRLVAGGSWCVEHDDGGRWLKRADEIREYTWGGEKYHAYRAAE